MKKLFKTLLAVMIAVVMSLAVFAFFGCSPKEPDPDPNPNPTPTPSGTYDKIVNSQYKAIELGGNIAITEDDETFELGVNGKLNLDGNADITCTLNGGDDGYSYVFLRDWACYSAMTAKATTDFTGKLEAVVDIGGMVDGYLAMLEQMGVELPDEVIELINLDKVIPLAIGGVNGELLTLAQAANAVEETDGKLTIDFNKAAYNIVNDVKDVIGGLKADTTVGAILANENVKKYLQLVTELVTPEELAAVIESVAGNMGGANLADEEGEEGAMAAVILSIVTDLMDKVKPDADSSTYDYIVKIISSQELVDSINDVLQQMGMPAGAGLTKKVSEFTLNEIFTLASEGESQISLDQMLTMAKQVFETYTSGITETTFKIYVFEEDETFEPFTLTGAKIVYNYDDNGLTSQNVKADVTVNAYSEEWDSESEGYVPVTETTNVLLDLTLTYKATAYAASDFTTLPEELPDFDEEEGPVIKPPVEVEVYNITNRSATFNFVDTEYDSTLTDEERAIIDELAEELSDLLGTTFNFYEDGSYENSLGALGEYIQQGNDVIVDPDDSDRRSVFTLVSYDTMIQEIDLGKATITLVYDLDDLVEFEPEYPVLEIGNNYETLTNGEQFMFVIDVPEDFEGKLTIYSYSDDVYFSDGRFNTDTEITVNYAAGVVLMATYQGDEDSIFVTIGIEEAEEIILPELSVGEEGSECVSFEDLDEYDESVFYMFEIKEAGNYTFNLVCETYDYTLGDSDFFVGTSIEENWMGYEIIDQIDVYEGAYLEAGVYYIQIYTSYMDEQYNWIYFDEVVVSIEQVS